MNTRNMQGNTPVSLLAQQISNGRSTGANYGQCFIELLELGAKIEQPKPPKPRKQRSQDDGEAKGVGGASRRRRRRDYGDAKGAGETVSKGESKGSSTSSEERKVTAGDGAGAAGAGAAAAGKKDSAVDFAAADVFDFESDDDDALSESVVEDRGTPDTEALRSVVVRCGLPTLKRFVEAGLDAKSMLFWTLRGPLDCFRYVLECKADPDSSLERWGGSGTALGLVLSEVAGAGSLPCCSPSCRVPLADALDRTRRERPRHPVSDQAADGGAAVAARRPHAPRGRRGPVCHGHCPARPARLAADHDQQQGRAGRVRADDQQGPERCWGAVI